MFSKKKLAAAGLVSLMMFNTSALALSPGDAIESSGIGTITEVGNIVTVPKAAEANFNNIGKIRWSQFNIPSTQQVDFEFTACGQTIINYIDPVLAVNPSLIAGKLNTFGTNGICGRVFVINPNGISFNGASINADLQTNNHMADYYYDGGIPSFLASSLDLATSFDSIDDNLPNIQLDTFTDTAGFANGIFVDNSEFGVNGGCWYEQETNRYEEGSLKEVSFIGNGVLIRDTNFDITFEGPDYKHCCDFDNFFNTITFGEALVNLQVDGDRDLTEISFLANNTVPACTDGAAGGVRYYEFDPDTLDITTNLASEFQIAICNDFVNDHNQIEVGPKEGYVWIDEEDGVFRLENRSDYFNTLGVPSTVKLASRVFLNEGKALIDLGRSKVAFLISKNPGQTTATNDPSLFILCPQLSGGTDTGIFIGRTANPHTEVETTGDMINPNNQFGLLTEGEGANQATQKTLADTAIVLIDGEDRNVLNKPSADPNEPCDPEDCFGDCATPPDPVPPPIIPPPPPGDGGGGGAAVAIPLGVVGGLGALGALAVPTPIASTPPLYTAYRAIPRYYTAAQNQFRSAFGGTPVPTGAAAPVQSIQPLQPIQPMVPAGGAAGMNPLETPNYEQNLEPNPYQHFYQNPYATPNPEFNSDSEMDKDNNK